MPQIDLLDNLELKMKSTELLKDKDLKIESIN